MECESSSIKGLIKHPYLTNAWFGEDQRTNTIEARMFERDWVASSKFH